MLITIIIKEVFNDKDKILKDPRTRVILNELIKDGT